MDAFPRLLDIFSCHQRLQSPSGMPDAIYYFQQTDGGWSRLLFKEGLPLWAAIAMGRVLWRRASLLPQRVRFGASRANTPLQFRGPKMAIFKKFAWVGWDWDPTPTPPLHCGRCHVQAQGTPLFVVKAKPGTWVVRFALFSLKKNCVTSAVYSFSSFFPTFCFVQTPTYEYTLHHPWAIQAPPSSMMLDFKVHKANSICTFQACSPCSICKGAGTKAFFCGMSSHFLKEMRRWMRDWDSFFRLFVYVYIFFFTADTVFFLSKAQNPHQL